MGELIVDTNNLGEAERAVSASFTPVRLTTSEGDEPPHTRIWRWGVGSMSIYAWDYVYGWSYAAAPPKKIFLTRVHSGAMELRTAGEQSERFGPGRVAALGAREGESYGGTFYRCCGDVFEIDRIHLSQIAAGKPHIEGPVRLTGSVPVSEAGNQQLVATMDYLRAAVANNSQAMQNPLVAGAAQRYLAASMLAAYPNTAVLEPTIEDRHDTTPVLLRRAIAFIDENAHTDITLTDIAAAVHITPRALQYMFRKHRDCTPMEHVQRVRLQHAHLDLLAADPTTTTVSYIAQRWGFGHLGRFAVRYRMIYGENPHVTLHR